LINSRNSSRFPSRLLLLAVVVVVVVVVDAVDVDSSTDRTELIVLLSTTNDAVIDAHNAGYAVIFPVDMMDVSPLF